jgi:hypothetical protein
MNPERCAECGFDATLLTTADATTALRSLGRRWRGAFNEHLGSDVPDDVLRRRPDPLTWSPLEYAAHTRDVLALLGHGLELILDGSRPVFPAIEPDPPGTDHGYNALDPERVLDSLERNATAMADRAARALPANFSRTATLGGEQVDAAWVLKHAVHDATHHLKDVERILGPS